MFEILKKSAITTKDNPILTLSFVIYLIIISFILPKMALLGNNTLFLIFLIALFVFAAAFFAGWFAMLKQAVANSNKKYESDESKLIDTFNVRGYFFSNIAGYILPLLCIFILYYVLFMLWTLLNIQIAEHFIGKIDFLFADLKAISGSKEQTLAYLRNLPEAKVAIIYGWQALFSLAYFVYGVLTVFWVSALYYAKNNSKNPFLALWKSVLAVFRKPLGVIGVNVFIALVFTILMFLGKFFAANAVLAFIYMICTIYLSVYMCVLLFSYYEKKLADNCDNRCDSVGEDREGDISSQEV